MPVKKHSSNTQETVEITVSQDSHEETVHSSIVPRLHEHVEIGELDGDVVRISRIFRHNHWHIWVYLKPTDPCQNCEHHHRH